MKEYSAGIIPFRYNRKGEKEYLLGHPGCPFSRTKNYWGFLKGHIEANENEKDAAIREFEEESGVKLTSSQISSLIPLGKVKQNSTKYTWAFGLEFPEFDEKNAHSNLVEDTDIPEIDEYRWFTYKKLEKVTSKPHLKFYTMLEYYEGNEADMYLSLALDEMTIEDIDKEIKAQCEVLDTIPWSEHYFEQSKRFLDNIAALATAKNLRKEKKDIKLDPIELETEGVLYTFDEFKERCKKGKCTATNGEGYYATKTKVSDAFINVDYFNRGYYRTDFDYVLWFKI